MLYSKKTFSSDVCNLLTKNYPDILFLGNDSNFSLMANNKIFDLNPVFTLCGKKAIEKKEEIILDFMRKIIDSESFKNGFENINNNFDPAKIMPRISNLSIFKRINKNLAAYSPFVNNTVKVLVWDEPEITVSLDNTTLYNWGQSIDDLEEIANNNISKIDLEFQVIESKEGGLAAIINTGDGYDASRLLHRGLHNSLKGILGNEFYGGIPSRDLLILFSKGPDVFINRIKDRIKEDFERLQYPISPELFLVTMDGIAGTIDREDV